MLLHLSERSPEPLPHQIARQLRGKVLVGDLPGGCPVPDARRLARQLRVSPACVAQAFDELIAEGVLDVDASASLRVASISPGRRHALAQDHLLDDAVSHELSLRDLELARDIQRRLLPPDHVETHGLTVVSRSFAARFVAGDFHDVIRHGDGSLGVVVADVIGKGFGASLIMASVKAMTPFVAEGRGTAATLRELNRRLHAELGRRQFVALAYARITPTTGAVELANAGMPDPLLLRPGAGPSAVEVAGPRLPLGIRPDVDYGSVNFTLDEGARLLLFSDGIPEAPRGSGEPLGYDGLNAIVSGMGWPEGTASAETWLDGVLEEALRITGPALEDDWTAVAVERGRRTP